jgi:putative ABC transport system permease protein
MLLVFFLIMVTGMCLWVGNGQNIQRVFTCYDSDLEIQYVDSNIRQEAENTIKQYTEITDSFSEYGQYINLNNNKLQCIALDKPEKISSIQQGRTCLYDNEILVTKLVAKDMGVNVGDTVTISLKGMSKDFIISGIYQCGNDLGSNFAMNAAGYERLTGNTMNNSDCVYMLKDAGKKDAIVNALSQTYGEKIKVSAESLSFIDTIVTAVGGIAAIIYTIAVVFVAVIVFMLCGKLFLREKTDIGIYKAVGFSSKRLRRQFAMRFAVVAAAGSILGLGLSACFSGACMNVLFSFMGVDGYSAKSPILVTLLPGISMTLIFYLFAYLLSGKIKKVNTKILISE